MKLKRCYEGLLLTGIVPLCFAATPATTQYVDTQVASVQSQIDTINSNPAIAHPVGSCYGDGIVFYTNTTTGAGTDPHGLIVKLADSTNGCTGGGATCVWANSTPVTVTTSPGYFTGQTNTNTIIANYTQPEAASAAYDTTAAADCPTCTNWYLPSQYELYALYAQSTLNGAAFWQNPGCTGTAPGTVNPYWSSSQVPGLPNTAWIVGFGNGTASVGNTTSARPVRAVRAF